MHDHRTPDTCIGATPQPESESLAQADMVKSFSPFYRGMMRGDPQKSRGHTDLNVTTHRLCGTTRKLRGRSNDIAAKG